jgi:hypothetical protein
MIEPAGLKKFGDVAHLRASLFGQVSYLSCYFVQHGRLLLTISLHRILFTSEFDMGQVLAAA